MDTKDHDCKAAKLETALAWCGMKLDSNEVDRTVVDDKEIRNYGYSLNKQRCQELAILVNIKSRMRPDTADGVLDYLRSVGY